MLVHAFGGSGPFLNVGVDLENRRATSSSSVARIAENHSTQSFHLPSAYTVYDREKVCPAVVSHFEVQFSETFVRSAKATWISPDSVVFSRYYALVYPFYTYGASKMEENTRNSVWHN